MKPENHLSIFSALEYIMVIKATLLAWWKMNPTLLPQTKLPVLVAMREKGELPGNRNPKVCSSFLSTPGVHMPGFPVGHDSLLMTKDTPKKPIWKQDFVRETPTQL